MYIIDEIGEDFVVVNGERIEVDPPFETLPDKKEYETWLNEGGVPCILYSSSMTWMMISAENISVGIRQIRPYSLRQASCPVIGRSGRPQSN